MTRPMNHRRLQALVTVTCALLLSTSTLAAQDPAYLVKELNTHIRPAGADPRLFVTLGGVSLFTSTGADGTSRELWRSDGTESGTYYLAPGGERKVVWNGRVWFLPRQFENTQIWSTDGTVAGTRALALPTSPTQRNLGGLMAGPDALYFQGEGGLWRTNGTTAGTTFVGNIGYSAGGAENFDNTWTVMGGSLYSLGWTEALGTALWRVDAGGGASLISSGKPLGFFQRVTSAGSVLFMFREPWADSMRLWRSDGTTAGTFAIRPDQPIIFNWGRMSGLVAVGSTSYFVGDDGTGPRLWRSDGTSAGTQVVATGLPGASASFDRAGPLARLRSGVILIMGDPLNPESPASDWRGVWAFDGIEFTFLQNIPAIEAGGVSAMARDYVVFGKGERRWRSDGTIGGTYALELVGVAGATSTSSMVGDGTEVVFGAYHPIYGAELFATDGTVSNTRMVKDIIEATWSAEPDRLEAINGGVVFRADDDSATYPVPTSRPKPLWFSDGTEAGTIELLASDDGLERARCGSRVFFVHSTPETGMELWSTDGTVSGTRLVKDIDPRLVEQGAMGSYPRRFACGDNRLFFLASSPLGEGIWRSDGTESGTLLVKVLSGEAGSSNVGIESALVPFRHRIYFLTFADYHISLWQSDGTPTGTGVVMELPDETSPWVQLIATTNYVYFKTGSSGDTIWRSDGTEAGTTPLVTGSFLSLRGAVGDRLIYGRSLQLCAIDESGTNDVCFGDADFHSSDFSLTRLNGRAYYNNPELYITDGFSAVATGIGEIEEQLAIGGGRLFGRRRYSHPAGTPLIETDGTVAGTRTIFSNGATEAVASQGRLFIAAAELYAYDLPVAALSFSPRKVSPAGGEAVTITGRGFTGPASVMIRGVVVQASVVSPTTITFIAPPNDAGTYEIELRPDSQRRITLDEPLLYACTPPIAVVDPLPSPLAPSTPVGLRGSGGRCAWFPETGLDDASSCTPQALPATNTTYTLVVFDGTGCESVNHPSVAVPDRVAPVGSVSAQRVTRVATTSFRLNATDAESVVGYLVSSSPTPPAIGDPGWVATAPSPKFYVELNGWPLLPGVNPINAWFRDAAGNISSTVSDTVILDQTLPLAGASINGGATYTRSRFVTVHVSASDDDRPANLFTSNQSTLPQYPQWLTFNTPMSTFEGDLSVTLTPGGGEKSAYAWVRDAAGNVSQPATDTILLDETYPTGSLALNPPGAYTTTPEVTLDLRANDANGIASIYISNDAAYPGGTAPGWIAVGPTVDFAEDARPWSLAPGDGPKAVTVWYRDVAGNSKAFSASTLLDQNPPAGTVSINGGAAYTSSNVVTLSLGATDALGVAAYCISNDSAPPTVDAPTWVAVTPATSFSTSVANWALATGTPQMSVYVWFKDTRGAMSNAVSASTMLDQAAPTGSMSIDGGAPYTRLTTATISLSAQDAGVVSSYYLSNDPATPSAAAAGWSSIAPAPSFTAEVAGWLLSGGTTLTAYTWFKDSAGNVSERVSASIELDQTPPSAGTLSLTPGAGRIDVSWSGQSDGKSGVAGYRLVYASGTTPPADCSGSVLATASPFAHQGLTQAMTYSYRLCTADVAGNWNAGAIASANTTANRLKGDLNGNGAVSALDASMILQAVVGASSLDEIQRCAADYNGNDSVSAFDAAMVLQCVVNPGTCSSGTCN